MLGYNDAVNTKWECYNEQMQVTVFTQTQNELIDRIIATINNAQNWEMSHPIVRAVLYDWATKQIIAVSNPINMPDSNSPENTAKKYEFLLPNQVQTTPKQYALGLHVSGYGGIDIQGAMTSDIESYTNIPSGASPEQTLDVTEAYPNYRTFQYYGILGGTPSPPKAEIAVSPPMPYIDQSVTFDGSASKQGYDGMNFTPIAKYEWSIDSEPTVAEITTTKIFTTPGDHIITLTVTDSQGLTDTKTTILSVIGLAGVEILASFDTDEDFEIGVENAPQCVLYSYNTQVLNHAPKIWTYGGYSQVYLQEKLGGGLFDYLNFAPITLGGAVPLSPFSAGTRAAMLELKNPNTTIDDETRRLEIFRIFNPSITETSIETEIYLPLDFAPEEWCVLLRLQRELMFKNPKYQNGEMFNLSIAITRSMLVPNSNPPAYRLTVDINHATRNIGRRYDFPSSQAMTLGTWHRLKGYVYRHITLGKIKVWLDDQLVIDLAGTAADAICTLYYPIEELNAVTPYNQGGTIPYGFVASGINLYKGDTITLMTPTRFYVKNTKISYLGIGELPPPVQDTLTISSDGTGTSNPQNGSYLYDEGATVQIAVVTGTLMSWELDGIAQTGQPQVTMDADHTVVLHFSSEVTPPPVTHPCALASATEGTVFMLYLPSVRRFRDRCLSKDIQNVYYLLSKYLAPKIKKLRGR